MPPAISVPAALAGGDVDGAYVAAYDGYRMAAESLLARQGLRARGGDGSHMTVEDAVSAQFATVQLAGREGELDYRPVDDGVVEAAGSRGKPPRIANRRLYRAP